MCRHARYVQRPSVDHFACGATDLEELTPEVSELRLRRDLGPSNGQGARSGVLTVPVFGDIVRLRAIVRHPDDPREGVLQPDVSDEAPRLPATKRTECLEFGYVSMKTPTPSQKSDDPKTGPICSGDRLNQMAMPSPNKLLLLPSILNSISISNELCRSGCRDQSQPDWLLRSWVRRMCLFVLITGVNSV